MKKLFANYNFEFDKNERKLISSFCKQALKQLGDEKQHFGEIKAFNSIIEKLNTDSETVKLTKDEKIRHNRCVTGLYPCDHRIIGECWRRYDG